MRATAREYAAPAFLLAGAGIFVADTLLVETGASRRPDNQLELLLHRNLPTISHRLAELLSAAGGSVGIGAVTVAVALWLFLRRRQQDALVVALGPAGAASLESLFKALFHRTRPHLWASAPSLPSYSYPSGHATDSMALAAVLCWLLWRQRSYPAPAALLIAAALAVGLSRIVLGVHYPTDVVGGEALAIAWVAALVILRRSQLVTTKAWRIPGTRTTGKHRQ